MHFKQDKIVFTLLTLTFLLGSCKKDYEGTSNIQNSINTVDELNQLVMGINFQGTLSNGMTINFTPSQLYTTPEGNTFTSIAGTNFTNPITIATSDFDGGNASIDFLGENFKFPVLFCTTARELGMKYPELEFSPYVLNYIIYLAAGDSKYSERDILYGTGTQFQVDHMLVALVNPNDRPIYLQGNLATSSGGLYALNGDYKRDGSLIVSAGYAYDLYGDYQSGSYTLYMNCDN